MQMMQARLFEDVRKSLPGCYLPILTITENGKGVLDIDTVKGCALGMKAYPVNGCYNECYACKTAKRYGIDFSVSISRKIIGREHAGTLRRIMDHYSSTWYRIGTAGDPCHDWDNTITVINSLRHMGKTPVIITKH